MRRAVNRLGTILNGMVTVLLVMLIAANLYIGVQKKITGEIQPDVFGWSTAVVISGSMEDTISVNDLVVIHRQPEYAAGDVITFENGDMVVTHRIAEEAGGRFITKGDANNTADAEPVELAQIIGKVVFTVPKIGAWFGFMKTPLGMTVLVLAGFLLLILPRMFCGAEDEKGYEQKKLR